VRSARLTILCLLMFAVSAAPAAARWTALGSGTGSGASASMPAGNQPSGSIAGQSVTVTWTQSTFLGSQLGTYGGGGYIVKRYAAGGSTPTTPNASCATTISGAGTTLQCVEAGVPYGSWQYRVTPVLNTFSGATSAASAAVAVVTAAPTLITVTAQNPTAGQTTGSIQASWSAASGATGYNIYRRTTGAFDYASPLNGATPIATTTYTDPGAGLSATTTYHYVVRAIAGSPAVESVSSADVSATSITRPAAPTGVTATAVAGAQINVAWSGVAGVAGYNVYRRTSAGSYDFNSPLNGATTVATTSYADTTSVNATTYLYTVRAVITGTGSAQVESASATESSAATADSTPPSAPSAASVTSGGPAWTTPACSGVTSGTRYVNNAGMASVGVSATIATPETGETVVFSATTPGSTPVTATVAAGATTVSTNLNLTTLLDGTVTLTARTQDAAGNLSATLAPVNAIIKDIVAASPTGTSYNDRVLQADQILGSGECGATIIAVKSGGSTYTSAALTAAGPFTLNVAFQALSTYSYNVTATDRAGNVSSIVVVSGTAVL
jgi:fibronectin type 3 domain-containing protein